MPAAKRRARRARPASRAGSLTVTHFFAAACLTGTCPVTVTMLVPALRETAIVVAVPAAEVRALFTIVTCVDAVGGVRVIRAATAVDVDGVAATMTVPAS